MLVCSRALTVCSFEKPWQTRALECLRAAKEPQLLPWYAEQLLSNARNDIVGCDQVGAAPSHF